MKRHFACYETEDSSMMSEVRIPYLCWFVVSAMSRVTATFRNDVPRPMFTMVDFQKPSRI